MAEVVRQIVDTGVFFRPEAMRRLVRLGTPVIVPAVAYAERLRHVAAAGGDLADFRNRLRESGFQVEPFSVAEADLRIPALGVLTKAAWHRVARDALIAGHVRSGDWLWTGNPKDFLAVGVPPDRIVVV